MAGLPHNIYLEKKKTYRTPHVEFLFARSRAVGSTKAEVEPFLGDKWRRLYTVI
jgi:hypothetical protein